MPKAVSVAKEFARLAGAGEEPDPLNNLRLQKLLYYAQGWSLVTRKTQLFPERTEAWRYGPVVREVYEGLPPDHGKKPIEEDYFSGAPNLAPEDAYFIGAVWEAYKRFSATALLEMTHKEDPWKKVWGDRKPTDRCEDEITVELMEEYFSIQDMDAALSAYEHRLEEMEKSAWEAINEMPQFDTVVLDRYAVS